MLQLQRGSRLALLPSPPQDYNHSQPAGQVFGTQYLKKNLTRPKPGNKHKPRKLMLVYCRVCRDIPLQNCAGYGLTGFGA
jgi:hypothetical protein